jgi:DNA-binding transcriptional MerR regulator
MGEEASHGQSRPELADLSSESGWVATDVAARALRVSPRTIRRYIDQGRLEAKLEGEGVRREWLVSVDSIHALRATRTFEDMSPRTDRASDADFPADSIADVLRELSARLERRAGEAAELRVRLEITERAQSTLDEERRRALDELEETRRRLDEAERERDELRQALEAFEESREEPPESAEPRPDRSAPPDAAAEAQEATDAAQEEPRRGFWSRWFGG